MTQKLEIARILTCGQYDKDLDKLSKAIYQKQLARLHELSGTPIEKMQEYYFSNNPLVLERGE